MRKTFSKLITLIVCIEMTACTDQYTICSQSKNSNLNAAFRTISNNSDVSFSASSLYMINLTTGNLQFDQKPGISAVSSNLSLLLDSTSFAIKVSATMPADTFTVYYNRAKLFLSLECGEIDVFNINRIKTTKNSIDSIKVLNAAVTNDFQSNINIYFK